VESEDHLEQWFDLSKPIPRDELETAVAQMQVYALKEGLDPNSKGVRAEVEAFRQAALAHNRRLRGVP